MIVKKRERRSTTLVTSSSQTMTVRTLTGEESNNYNVHSVSSHDEITVKHQQTVEIV